MAAPTFIGQSDTPSNGPGTDVTWPVGHQADDIGILVIQSAAQTPATPAGWTFFQGASVGTAGAAGSTALYFYWKRAASAAEAALTIANPGDHRRARILAFRGCETSGSPIDAVTSDTEGTVDVSVVIPGIITLVNECYVVQAVGNATDTSSNQTTAGAWANASLTGFTRLSNGNTTAGVGGGWDIGGGEKATAGTVSGVSLDLATASAKVMVTFALRPPQGAPPPAPVTEGGIYVATSVKATAGAVSATTATLDTAAVQARITFALKPPAAPPVNQPPVVAAIPALVGSVNGFVGFPVDYSDPEGDTVTLSLVDGDSAVPAGAALVEDEASGNFSFEWTPSSTQAGEWNFYIRATDGTNTVDTPVSISIQAAPDTTLRDLAVALAERAHADLASARALADMLELREQMNSKVLHDVRTLISDLEESETYVQDILDQIEEVTEPT